MEGLCPINKSLTKYEGFLKVNGELFHVCLDQSEPTKRILCDWKLRYHVREHLDLLQKRFNQCKDIVKFFSEFTSVAENCIEEKTDKIWHLSFYDIVITHLQKLGWDKVKAVDDDFTKLKLMVEDSGERIHILNIELTYQYPKAAPKVTTILPVSFSPLWTYDGDLVALYDQFKMTLQQFDRLWDEVDELKQCTWILEPENPNYAATSFRLALGNSCSIQVKVDPLNVGAVPECHFLGADWAISPLRERFLESFEEWNEELSLYQNLNRILDIEFPAREKSGCSQDMSLQCGICYAFRLDSEIPDQICNNKNCGQSYHHQCLFEWIKSIPGSKQSFNVIFGECPYCTNPMKLNLLSVS